MKKSLLVTLLCVAVAALALVGCSNSTGGGDSTAGNTLTITDHNGNVVELPTEINRIAVADIYPFPSVLTVFLGSSEKIVGISPESMAAAENGLLGELYPEILTVDTSFIKGSDLNVEQLLSLEPDVVFYSADNNDLGSNLANAGIPAVAISAGKWDYNVLETYNQWMALLSEIFPDSAKSTEVSAYSQEIYDMIQERVKDLPDNEKKSVFFLFKYDDQQIMTSGEHFFGQFWCDAVGAVNAANELETDNAAPVNMEQVYAWNPDIVLITNFTSAQPDDLYHNTIGSNDWSQVTAVKDKHVYKMPLGIYRSYTPSADTPVTLLWVAKTVYPELFSDIDLTKEVKDYYLELYGIEVTDAQVEQMYNPSSNAGSIF